MVSPTPKIYILKYDLDEDSERKRTPYREAHREYLQKYVDNGSIILAGPLEQPTKYHVTFIRDLSEKEIDDIAKHDPYFINDVVTRYRIMPFFASTGDPALKNDFVQH